MWNYELANKLKGESGKAREKAVSDASAFIGVVKQRMPLIVQITEEMIYYDDDIIESYRFHELLRQNNPYTINVGDKVIVMPVNTLDTIAVIDKAGD